MQIQSTRQTTQTPNIRQKTKELASKQQEESPAEPDPQLDLFAFSARNPRTTAAGVGLSTMISTAVPGIVAGVAASTVPGLSPITKAGLEMFSAFSVMGSLGSASWAYSKAKRKFIQREAQYMTAKLKKPGLKDRGSLLSTSKSLAGHALTGSLLGIGVAGLAATGLELAARSILPPNWTAGIASTGITYLGLATLTHNALNAELGHRWT